MKLSDTDLSLADRQMVENNLMQQEELLWVGSEVISGGILVSTLSSDELCLC